LLVHIIDLGINNLSSVERAFSNLANIKKVTIVGAGANSIKESADIVVLPGLGNFGAAAKVLFESEIPSYIHKQIAYGSRVIGICLGMQLLGNSSDESQDSQGLGLIDGTSTLLPKLLNERIPHVGWNEVNLKNESNFRSLASNRDFYFTHSYTFNAANQEEIFTTTPYGTGSFISSIKKDRIFGFQFHPEKSGKAGHYLIQELVNSVK
jgi:glutamine amidotransferase